MQDATTPTPLFRNEVIRFQAARLQGEVAIRLRLRWLVLGFVCAALAIGVIVTAALVGFDRLERIAGRISSDSVSAHEAR